MYKVNILVVEKNQEAARRISDALKESKAHLEIQVMTNGADAMDYLQHKGGYLGTHPPHVIILELNLNGKDGREVLTEIKHDEQLKRIPVLVFSESDKIDDVEFCYENYANSYIIKPEDEENFSRAIKNLEAFWFRLVKLPTLAGSRY